jgi:hypothetical protein
VSGFVAACGAERGLVKRPGHERRRTTGPHEPARGLDGRHGLATAGRRRRAGRRDLESRDVRGLDHEQFVGSGNPRVVRRHGDEPAAGQAAPLGERSSEHRGAGHDPEPGVAVGRRRRPGQRDDLRADAGRITAGQQDRGRIGGAWMALGHGISL